MLSKAVVEVCAAAWIDLLGYGSMLRKVQFDPTSPTAAEAVARLDRFHAHVATAASKYSTALVINDGAVICRDLSARSISVTFDFIRRIVELHSEINKDEHSKGHPGARCVVAAGFRIRRTNHHKQSLVDGYGAHLIKKLEDGTITAQEGIKSAITVKPFIASMPEVQANFAFTKAYLADIAGSGGGFAGPKVFLDLTLLSSPSVPWVAFSEIIDWSEPGIQGQFGAIQKLDVSAAGRARNTGCRDAYQIAEALSTSPDILDRLKKLRIKGSRKAASTGASLQ